MLEIHSKYAGKSIAFIDEKIVAFGNTTLEAYTQARMIYPKGIISLMRVPRKKEIVTFL